MLPPVLQAPGPDYLRSLRAAAAHRVPPPLCDSHTHLDQFDDATLEGMLARAADAGVVMIVSVGTTLESSRRAVELAERHALVYAGVGLHPQDIKGPVGDAEMVVLRRLALSSAKVVCVSETGLDFQAASPDRRWQEESLRRHVRLARELGKAVDFHAREAYEDILPVLREERIGEVGAIWHYFQGDARHAAEAIGLGCYISLAKPLLRETALQEAVREIPLERMVLETDSYPQLFKKNAARRTEPAHVAQVAEKVAEIKGVAFAEVAEATTANLRRALRMG
ncbi:MAG: TatD family deoxyribonuclease [Dehalococcoidia bacterium]|nr:TatD family deoxyribonuclease [Dehalococcoidia bacterium]